MAQVAWPARWSGTFPAIQHYVADATNGAAIVVGSFVLTAADGEIELCGADPTAVLGVAIGKFNGSAGYGMPSSPTAVIGRAQTIPVAIAKADTIFVMEGTSNPTLTNINESYGVVNTSGVWKVDLTETTTKVVVVVDVDLTRNLYFCKIHEDVAEHSAAT